MCVGLSLVQRCARARVRVCVFCRPAHWNDERRARTQDLDYTLFDLKGGADRIADLCRPFMHECLAAAYRAGFDICVWSQTGVCPWSRVYTCSHE